MTEIESSLLRRFTQSGDPDAFSQITRLYAQMVYGACLRVTGDAARAADATQETFFQLLKNAGKVTGSLGSWLHRVATRRAMDLVRQDAARRRREEAFAASALQETDNWSELSPVVDEAMDELGDEPRELLFERFLEGKTTVEMAADQGVSQPTVSRRVDHALTELRERLRHKGVLVALPVLAALMSNTVQAAPEAVLAELGKMSLAASGAAVSTAGTATNAALSGTSAGTGIAALLPGKSFKVALVSAAAVAVVGLGGLLAYRHSLRHQSQPSRQKVAQAPNAAGPRRTPVTVVGGGAVALGFGGVAAGPSVVSIGRFHQRTGGPGPHVRQQRRLAPSL